MVVLAVRVSRSQHELILATGAHGKYILPLENLHKKLA